MVEKKKKGDKDDELDGCEVDFTKEDVLTSDEEVAALLIDEEPARTEAQWEYDDAV